MCDTAWYNRKNSRIRVGDGYVKRTRVGLMKVFVQRSKDGLRRHERLTAARTGQVLRERVQVSYRNPSIDRQLMIFHRFILKTLPVRPRECDGGDQAEQAVERRVLCLKSVACSV